MNKTVIKSLLAMLLISFCQILKAQSTPFNISIEPVNINGLGGIQSFAFGQYNGRWLIVGGRLDGLHQRQPFAAFDLAGHNNQLIVVDPVSKQKWSAPLTSLPVSIQEQLSATNMEFHQEGNILYYIGGYGYSATLADHTTFDKLTAIDVPAVINAIISNNSFSAYFRQIADTQFSVTGGHLSKINNTYYLVGGQQFIGRYNPMGPTHGPGFFQKYTNAIRKFNLADNGTSISIEHLPGSIDSINLHRRDYNVVSQILPNGTEGITAFSGVFQPTVDLPFLNAVNINSTSYAVNNAFTQHYNHYHCAVIPLYSASNNEMHSVFFGGIAQFYDNNGMLVQDNNVPFVKTIARVTRDASGTMAEYKLPVEMPALLGAGAEFIPLENLPTYPNGVIALDSLSNNPTLLGYIYGGISSTAQNIFFTNTGTQSSASSQIFKVSLQKGAVLGSDDLNEHSISALKLMVYPNPNNGSFIIRYQLAQASDVKITLIDINGKLIAEEIILNQHAGEITYRKKIEQLIQGGTYFLNLETSFEKATQKIIIEP